MQSRTFLSAAIICLFPLFVSAQLCMPSVTLHNGLSVNIHPVDSNGDGITDFAGAVVRLRDLILRADDRCNSGVLSFGMRKTGTGGGMATDSTIVYDCTELGTQLIEVWVRNASGLSNYSETYIIIQDNNSECGPAHIPESTACAADHIFPEIFSINGLSGPLRVGSSGEPYLSVSVSNLVHTVYDNCGGPYQYRLRKSGTGTGVPKDTTVVFNCDERGIQIVEVWAGDPAGNWNFSETYVSVQDNAGICDAPPLSQPVGCWPDKTPPELLVYNGFSQGVVWESAGPVVRVHASDFIRLGRDKCHDNLGWRIGKADNSLFATKPPKSASSSVTFSCDELGAQPVIIWLRDGAGNWTKAESYVLVQDNTGACGPGSGLHQVVIPEFKQEIVARLGGKPVETTPRAARPATASGLPISVWPNPAIEGFTLNTRLEREGPVSIRLYDNVGRLAQVLADQQWMDAGLHQQYFARQSLPAGMYRCVVHSAQGVQTVVVVLQ